jgi:hypothetical protein
VNLLHDRLYYRPSELANRWNVSIDFLMQLGLTNQLKFKAEVDWYYPTTQTIYRSSHVQVDYEELANIYYAPTSFDVEAYAGEVQNPPGVLPGDPCIITYYPGVERLLIDAAEVNDYEKCHQESLHQPTVAESLANWSNDDEFERLAPTTEPIPGKFVKPLNDDNELLRPILKRAKIKRLPEKLGLNDISTLMFHHRREKEGVFSWSIMQFNFVRWIMDQIAGGQIPIEGYTSRELVCLGPSLLEPIIHKDEIYTCLQILDLLPLEDGCLLANWWPDETLAESDKPWPKSDDRDTSPSSTGGGDKLKSQKQVDAILETIKLKKWDPMRIPDGEKGTIQKICENDYPLIFDKQYSFDEGWKAGRKRELFRMANHPSYSKRGQK